MELLLGCRTLKIFTGGWDYWLPATKMEGQKKAGGGRVQGMKKS